MTATPIPGYTIEKVRNALHSTNGVSLLFFVHGSVVKVYPFTENLCVRYTEASCGVLHSSVIVGCKVVSLSARVFLQNVRQHALNDAASLLRRTQSSN